MLITGNITFITFVFCFWFYRYIDKRLKFLGNKYYSQIGVLVFLSLWHGFHSGYYVTFAMEFFGVVLEKDVSITIDFKLKLNHTEYKVLPIFYNKENKILSIEHSFLECKYFTSLLFWFLHYLPLFFYDFLMTLPFNDPIIF